MKYSDAVSTMVNDKGSGFNNIQQKGSEFQASVLNEISKSKCSFPTAHVFISFVEDKLRRGKEVDFSATMLESAIFITNGMGFDSFRYSEIITNLDLAELKRITTVGASKQ
jgi:hypothetical protein